MSGSGVEVSGGTNGVASGRLVPASVGALGVCQATAFFQYDSNNDFINDAPFIECASLPVRSAATTGVYDDAADWGCQKFSNSQFVSGPKTKNPALSDIRIGGGSPVPVIRHRFD